MIKTELIKNKIFQYNKEVEEIYSKIIEQSLAIKDIDKESIKNLIKEKETLYNKKMLHVKELFTLLAKTEQENKKQKEVNEKQLYEFIDNMPIGIARIDKNYNFTFLNKFFRDQIKDPKHRLGNSLHNIKDQIIGKNLREIIGKEGFNAVKKFTDKALKGQIVSFIDYQPKFNIYYLTKLFPLYDKRNDIIGVQTANIDITEQKLHELHKSQTDQFLDNMPVGIIHMNKNYNVTFFNKFFKERIENKKDPIGKLLYNIKDKIVGRSLIEIVGEKKFNRAKKFIDQALKGKTTSFFDYYPQFNVYYLTRCFPIYDKKNNIVGVQTIDIDITKHKLHEFQKFQTDQFHDNMPIAISEYNLDTKLIKANKQYYEIFKNTEYHNNIIGKKAASLFGNEGIKVVLPYFSKALTGEIQRLSHYQPKLKSHYFSTFVPNYNEKNQVISVNVACIDITELKNNQTKLESTINELTKTNTELENYSHTIAHDLREPIRAISVIAESLEKETPDCYNADRSKAKILIKQIKDNSEFMDNLICNLLDYYNIDNQIDYEEKSNIKKILDEIINNYNHIVAKEINIVEKIDIPIISINKLHLRQLLQNIIGNAIKYNNSKIIKLEIDTYVKKNDYVISIKDNGIGIDKEHHKYIFDVKYKVPSKKQKGSGLGLAICKKIIDSYKGKICAKSHSYGSIFTLHIPK